MNAYTGILRMRLIANMQYRTAAWAGIATQFFWGLMQLMIFAAFYRSSISLGNPPAPMSLEHLADYIWLRQAFLALLMLWIQDNELLDNIVSGHVAYELCRPCQLYSFWFCRLVASRLANTALRFLPILLITGFLPKPYTMHLPANASAAGLFLIALTLALTLVVSVSMFIYLLTFVLLSANGARLFIGVAGEFLMGAVIPIPLMPERLQSVVNVLPFRYMADFPFRIYSGSITGTDALNGILMQIAWAAVLIAAGLAGFQLIQRRIVVQGG